MTKQLQLITKDVFGVTDAPSLWKEIVDSSPEAWHWHTWSAKEFNLCAGGANARDLSFFVYKDDEPIGVVPLHILKNSAGEPEALYYSGILPCPVFKDPSESQEDFAFAELERRAKDAGARRSRLWYTPPTRTQSGVGVVTQIAKKFGYGLKEIPSHVVVINNDTLLKVRERYIRYHKKFAPECALTVVDGPAVTKEIEENYMRLHTKNAARQVRSRESYAKQADIVRAGEGFYAVAEDNASKETVGMLLVSCYKNAAYDNSVAIDPDHSEKYIGHLLKWRAIEELQKRKIPTYELGPVAGEDADQKEKGISHFKEGWSRGNTRTIWELRKEF